MANAKPTGAHGRTDHPTGTQPDMSAADLAAPAAASYVRTVVTPKPTQVPPLPTELRARRRELTRRGW